MNASPIKFPAQKEVASTSTSPAFDPRAHNSGFQPGPGSLCDMAESPSNPSPMAHETASPTRDGAAVPAAGAGGFTGRMYVVCSWCQNWLGMTPCIPEKTGQISHTICAKCSKEFFGKDPSDQNSEGA